MTARTLFSLSLDAIWKAIRRGQIKRKIRAIERDLEVIKDQRDNDHRAERVLICRRLYLQSELQDL